MLTACGFGGDGQFRCVRGDDHRRGAGGRRDVSVAQDRAAPSGRATAAAACSTRAGRLVGVVWGCRDGETYRHLRPARCAISSQRILPQDASVLQAPSARDAPSTAPTLDWQAWRDEIEARLAALDAKKQDRATTCNPATSTATRKTTDVDDTIASSPPRVASESLRDAHAIRTHRSSVVEQRISPRPGLSAACRSAKLLAGALGLSGPVAVAVIIAGGLAGRRIKTRRDELTSSRTSTRNAQPSPSPSTRRRRRSRPFRKRTTCPSRATTSPRPTNGPASKSPASIPVRPKCSRRSTR